MTCEIVNGNIIVTVPLDALPTALAYNPYAPPLDPDEHKPPRISDMQVFARDVVRALLDEDELGGTLLTRVFDEAMERAIEDGSEGIED